MENILFKPTATTQSISFHTNQKLISSPFRTQVALTGARKSAYIGIFTNGTKTLGNLYLYNYASPRATPTPLSLLDFPAARTDFHPLGIEYHAPSHTLFVTNHAVAGPRLEIFRLYLGEHSAAHIRTVTHPQIHSPNSIAVVDEENIYLTNDHFFLCRYHPWLAVLETYLGIPGGNVVHINLPTMKVTKHASIPFANGLKFLNETTLAVSSTNAAEVYLYDVDTGTHALKFKTSIKVPFLPDNLSVDAKRTLLIAGHGHARSTGEFAFSRALCRRGSGPEAEEACKIRSPSFVAEWSEAEGLKVLYADVAFSTSCTAVRDVERGIGFVTGLFEDGLLVWKE